jgi:hypothetical protein
MVFRTEDVMLFVEKKRGWCLKYDRMCEGISGPRVKNKFDSGGGTVRP